MSDTLITDHILEERFAGYCLRKQIIPTPSHRLCFLNGVEFGMMMSKRIYDEMVRESIP